MEPSTSAKKFAKEFLAASAVFVLCLLWIFRTSLLTGQVAAFDARPQASQGLFNLMESVYEVESAMVVQTRMLKEGFFPSWTPYSAGGNPLIGKMQNGVFAPEHLLLYFLPLAALPYVLMLVVACKLYLAYIFTYLYARCLRLDVFGGIAAGIIYVFSEMVTGGLLSWSGTAPYLPLLLLLVEIFLRGHQRLAQLLLPWGVAFAFFSGHFESAVYICIVTGFYFMGRVWNDRMTARSEKFRQLLGFIWPASIGVILAGVQIAPAFEYVQNSYSKTWHNSSYFGFWDFETISKHLSMADAPMLGVGFTGLLFFVLALKRHVAARDKSLIAQMLPLFIAALSLAAAVASLSNLGLDDSLSRLAACNNTVDLLGWVSGFFMLFISLWIWREDDQSPGIKILGGIMIGSIALMLNLPLLTNALLHLPLFINFHNASGHRWEFRLATAVLSASAIQRIGILASGPWQQRLKSALRAASVLFVLMGGYLISQPLKGIAARLIPTGIDDRRELSASLGGIMGPQREITFNRTQTIVGWVAASLPVKSISIELVQDGQPMSSKQVDADISLIGGRRYFHAVVPTPDEAGPRVPYALLKYADGTQKILQGGIIDVRKRGGPAANTWLLIGSLLLFPLIFFSGAIVPRCAAALLVFWMMGQCPSDAIPASQRPYRLGGIEKIKEDPELLRIGSLQENFLQADYPNVYGISDIRTGGDNIDFLAHTYFFRLCLALLHYRGPPVPQQESGYQKGLRLLGRANVKYLISPPDASLPNLETTYSGKDMLVFKNPFFRPRAEFYDHSAYFSMGDRMDFGKKTNLLGTIMGMIMTGTFNDPGLLLLNDVPPESFTDSPQAGATQSSVLIKEYSPDKVRIEVLTNRQGLLFLGDTLFPGWVAFRNGAKVPILRSWLTFRAVQVPAGKSVVEFLYRPIALLTTLAISVSIALGWVILYYRYKFDYPSLITTPTPAPGKKQKKIAAPEPVKEPDEDAVMIGLCSASAEWIEGSLIAAMLFYWTVWAALRYEGGIQHRWRGDGWEINVAACAVLVIGATTLLGDLKKRITAKP
jgi:hypothetical protein